MRPWTGVYLAPDVVQAAELQWGHGLAAVDGRAHGKNCGAASSFNGATALRPWTAEKEAVDAAVAVLQWGHGLAAVDGQEAV